MLVKTYAAAVHGINAIVVTVETVVSKGVQYCIVGLPDTAVKGRHGRVGSSVLRSGFGAGGVGGGMNMASAGG